MHVIQSTTVAAVLVATALVAMPGAAVAQYKLDSPAGEPLVFERDQVRGMLDTTRALYRNLEEDPAVLYALGVGASVPEDNPADALPWNAIEVRNDSIALIQTPSNLREADRAYANYAVLRMAQVRTGDPDAPCDELMEAESRVVSAFVDGWIVARILFGGARFEPLDRLAFIREAGHLPAFIALSEDPSLGVCANQWADENAVAIEEYRVWYDTEYRGETLAAESEDAESHEDGGADEIRPQDSGGAETGSSSGS